MNKRLGFNRAVVFGNNEDVSNVAESAVFLINADKIIVFAVKLSLCKSGCTVNKLSGKIEYLALRSGKRGLFLFGNLSALCHGVSVKNSLNSLINTVTCHSSAGVKLRLKSLCIYTVVSAAVTRNEGERKLLIAGGFGFLNNVELHYLALVIDTAHNGHEILTLCNDLENESKVCLVCLLNLGRICIAKL